MWPFNRVRKPSAPRLVDLENRLDEVETAVAWLRKANIDLNARVTTVQRRNKEPGGVGAELGPESAQPGTDPAADPRLHADVLERRRRLRGF